MAFSESKKAQLPADKVLKYGIFDRYGTLVGFKEEAPVEFKEAYEHDKKMRDESLEQGIIL